MVDQPPAQLPMSCMGPPPIDTREWPMGCQCGAHRPRRHRAAVHSGPSAPAIIPLGKSVGAMRTLAPAGRLCTASPPRAVPPSARPTIDRRRQSQIETIAAAARGRTSDTAEKRSIGASILSSVLSLSSAPYSLYVPEPKTFLHHASAEVKQLWIVATLVIMARASLPMRLAIAGVLVAATMTALPRRLWEPQLFRLGGLCAMIFFFTLIGGEVAPVLSERSVGVGVAASAAASAAAGAAAGELPASMVHLGAPPYRYVLLRLGWITVTKRSLNLALAIAGLTFAALQSASLCLVTTPPEGMARAVGRPLRPLGLLGLPVKELVLTLLLALRFMATVFEECRNLCLGLASRGVDWRHQGLRGTLAICVGIGSKLFTNLMARCDSIAVAMAARGFRGPQQHVLYPSASAAAASADEPPAAAPRLPLPSAADCIMLAFLALLAAASYAFV